MSFMPILTSSLLFFFLRASHVTQADIHYAEQGDFPFLILLPHLPSSENGSCVPPHPAVGGARGRTWGFMHTRYSANWATSSVPNQDLTSAQHSVYIGRKDKYQKQELMFHTPHKFIH